MVNLYPGYKSNTTPAYVKPELPVGAYVCKICGVEYRSERNALVLSLDIAEGEHKGFFDADYRNNPYDNKTWGCVMWVNIPAASDDDKTKQRFERSIGSIELSNKGYTFTGEESTLKGKTVGVNFQREEGEYNGKRFWKVRPKYLLWDEDVRTGKYKALEDKPLREVAPDPVAFVAVQDDDTDLPF